MVSAFRRESCRKAEIFERQNPRGRERPAYAIPLRRPDSRSGVAEIW